MGNVTCPPQSKYRCTGVQVYRCTVVPTLTVKCWITTDETESLSSLAANPRRGFARGDVTWWHTAWSIVSRWTGSPDIYHLRPFIVQFIVHFTAVPSVITAGWKLSLHGLCCLFTSLWPRCLVYAIDFSNWNYQMLKPGETIPLRAHIYDAV